MLIFKEDMNIFLRHLYSYFCYTLQHNLSMEKKIEVEKTYGKTQSLEIFLFFLGKCHFEKNPIFFQKKTRFSPDFPSMYTAYSMSHTHIYSPVRQKARQNNTQDVEKFYTQKLEKIEVEKNVVSPLKIIIFEKVIIYEIAASSWYRWYLSC